MNKLVHDFQDLVKEGRVHVPAQVRETIEASVDQVRTKWATMSDALQEASKTQLSVSSHVIDSIKTNLDASAEFMVSLTRATSVMEAVQIQGEFATAQWARQLEQTQKLVSIAAKGFTESAAVLKQ